MSHPGCVSLYVGEVLIIYPQGKRITTDEDAQHYLVEFKKLIASAKHQKVLINFENVEFVSSAMLGVIVRVNNQCRVDGVILKFCCFSKVIKDIIRIAALHRLLEIYDTEAEALAAFERRGGWFS